VVFPDRTLSIQAAVIRADLTGKPYASCDVFEDINTGSVTLDKPEDLLPSSKDIGGGTRGTSLSLQVPLGYQLTNVLAHCSKLEGDNPCMFVRNGDTQNIQWTIPKRRAELHPTTDSQRVTVWLSGTKQKEIVATNRVKHPRGLTLVYGRRFSVEFPGTAADVKLYCNAGGNQRIFSLSDLEKEGDQIYLKGVRNSATGKVMDLGVQPFDVGG